MAEIKASYFAGTLKALGVLGADTEQKVRDQLRGVVEGFDGFSRLDWVPVQWDIELNHVLYDFGGMSAVREVNRRAFVLGAEGPLLRPLISSAVSLFGVSPRTFLKFIARGWSVSTRGMGTIELLALEESKARISFTGLPPVALEAIWLEGFCGVERGICDITNATGDAPSPTVIGNEAHYELIWRKR